jgi:hypothetical protein
MPHSKGRAQQRTGLSMVRFLLLILPRTVLALPPAGSQDRKCALSSLLFRWVEVPSNDGRHIQEAGVRKPHWPESGRCGDVSARTRVRKHRSEMCCMS